MDDIEFYWGMIDRIRGGLPRQRRRGRPKNITTRYEVLREMTWSEIRQYIRNNRRELVKLEHEYVDLYGKHSPRVRSKAKHNFYKQVIVHPEMRDLGLQIRKRGRPRKTSN